MGKPPSRVGKWLNPWKRLSDASTAEWLWNLLPSSVVAVISGGVAYLENLPVSVIGLIALTALALTSFIAAKVRVYRAHAPQAAEDETERIYRIKRAEADAEDRIRRERADNPPAPPPAKFDMPLKAVLERIAFESEWSVTRQWDSPSQHWQKTMWEKPLAKELLRPLASGDIPSRGIKSTKEGDEHGHSDIPETYWRNPKLDIEANRLLCEPGFGYVFNFAEGVMYHDVRLRRADVDHLWPARSDAEKAASPSPFIEWARDWKARYDEHLLNAQVEQEQMRARALAEIKAESRRRMPLHQVVRWIARDSVWATRYRAKDDHWVEHALKELQLSLSRGEVTADGFRSLRNGAEREPGVRPIKSDFWAAAQWRMENNFLNENITFHASRGTEEQFNFIELDEGEVKRRWPPRSSQDEAQKNSPVERVGNYDAIFAAQDDLYRYKRGSPQDPMDAMFGEEG